MKTKIKLLAIILVIACGFAMNVEKKSNNRQSYINLTGLKQANAASGEYNPRNMYQTMAYCRPMSINYACKKSRTAERCRRYYCLVSW